MGNMFYNCFSLIFLDLSNFSLNNYTNIENMFLGFNKDVNVLLKIRNQNKLKMFFYFSIIHDEFYKKYF